MSRGALVLKHVRHDVIAANVMDEMRGCDTAVIHVGADGLLFDDGQKEEPGISGDVLIEIGAAMALYGRNFILLVEEGVTLPSNLQGLCTCRYSGEQLDMPATMTLFKAFNGFTKSQPTRPLVLAIMCKWVCDVANPGDGIELSERQQFLYLFGDLLVHPVGDEDAVASAWRRFGPDPGSPTCRRA